MNCAHVDMMVSIYVYLLLCVYVFCILILMCKAVYFITIV